MTTQAYLGQFYLAAESFTVNATGKSTTAGFYYLEGYSGETQLIEAVEALIAAVYVGATVTLSKATGKITIDLATTGSITWAATAPTLMALLGYTGNLSGSQTYVATNKARYCWVPLHNGAVAAPAETPNALTAAAFWNRVSTSRVVRASDGTASSVEGQLTTGEGELVYHYLDKASVRKTATPDPGTFEQLWLDTFAKGRRCRVVLDVATATDPYAQSLYVEAMFTDPNAEQIGRIDDYIERAVDNLDAMWNVRVPLVEFNP